MKNKFFYSLKGNLSFSIGVFSWFGFSFIYFGGCYSFSGYEPDAGELFGWGLLVAGYLLIVGWICLIGVTLGIQSLKKDQIKFMPPFNATSLGVLLTGSFFTFAVVAFAWAYFSIWARK